MSDQKRQKWAGLLIIAAILFTVWLSWKLSGQTPLSVGDPVDTTDYSQPMPIVPDYPVPVGEIDVKG
jgi:hypothetical protein